MEINIKIDIVDEEIPIHDDNKQMIIDKFIKNIKGKEIIIENSTHCGSE